MMSLDYQRYYDLETFLFEDVYRRFRDNGSIGAFEFFSIVIWKANRAKSITAKRAPETGIGRRVPRCTLPSFHS